MRSSIPGFFSYDGHMLGILAGYHVTPRTLLTGGYSYLTRIYDEPSGFETDYHTVSAEISRTLTKKISLSAGYSRQFIDSTVESNASNNIFSIGLNYGY